MNKAYIILLCILCNSVLVAQTTSYSNVEKGSESFETVLVKFYIKEYPKYFLEACNVNKADVSFKLDENGKIADLLIKSPSADIDDFLRDAIKTNAKDIKSNLAACNDVKTISFVAYFNFTVDCDRSRIPIRNYDEQRPAPNFSYKNGFKIIKEEKEKIVLDKIVFHGAFVHDSPFSNKQHK